MNIDPKWLREAEEVEYAPAPEYGERPVLHEAMVRMDEFFLLNTFRFPPGTRLRGATVDDFTGDLILRVEHPDLKGVPEGDAAPTARPRWRKQDPIIFEGWGQ